MALARRAGQPAPGAPPRAHDVSRLLTTRGGLALDAPGVPALDAFPFALWARLSARFHRGLSGAGLAYGEALGFRPLREAIAGYVGAARGITCSADNVLVTTGTQSATYIAALAATDRGEPAWVEDPGYDGTRLAMRLADLRTVAVRVDDDGIDVAYGCSLEPGARLAVVSPSHQFPTGVVMSLTRRLALIEWAARAGAYVIEDDYDSEFRYDGEPIASLKALDGDRGRVLYVGTLSKVLAPGLRLGFLIVPDHLIDAARAVRFALDRQVSLPLQAIASDFIGNGHLGQHIRKLRAVYAERRGALLEALDSLGGGLFRVSGAATGVHVLGELPQDIDDAVVARRARARRVGVEPLTAYRMSRDLPLRRPCSIGFCQYARGSDEGCRHRLVVRAAAAGVSSENRETSRRPVRSWAHGPRPRRLLPRHRHPRRPLRRPPLHRRQDDRDLLPPDLPGAHAQARERAFFPTAAAAQEAGFRPCLRCRPETSPDLAFWRGTSNTVSRALALIEAGALDEAGVEALAERLGVGGRQLRRLFRQHLGASPVAVAQTRRVLLAKQLIHETRLPMAEVAMASGFGSIRRFNETFQRLFGRPPAACGARRRRGRGRPDRSRAPDLSSRPMTGTPCWPSCAPAPFPASRPSRATAMPAPSRSAAAVACSPSHRPRATGSR